MFENYAKLIPLFRIMPCSTTYKVIKEYNLAPKHETMKSMVDFFGLCAILFQSINTLPSQASIYS